MMIGVMCACMPSVAYSYRNVKALQGVREKLSPKISALMPSAIFKSRGSSLPTVRVTEKSVDSRAQSHNKEGTSWFRLDDTTASNKSFVSQV